MSKVKHDERYSHMQRLIKLSHITNIAVVHDKYQNIVFANRKVKHSLCCALLHISGAKKKKKKVCLIVGF